ncbi:hypothetical protein Tco_1413223 [Tanacetum coccineum]
MDNPNITMEEYIRLEEERAQRHGETFNWQTATFGKVRDFDKKECFTNFEAEFLAIVLGNINAISSQTSQGTTMGEYEAEKEDSEIEFPAIVLNDTSTYNTTLSYEPTVSLPSNDEIDFRISFDESNDEDYTASFIMMAKSEPVIEPSEGPQIDDENETSLSKYDEKEQNALNRNNLLPFCKIYPDNSKSDRDNDDDKMKS